ncbi:Intermediate filament protein [Apophysomyces sp. BC1034]|nr:Intermediate filament protein [Apophysomyces sp. BC1015]KAG0173837.1 Intermediate filament protein [Apophysomyces sp. BC1021]KAG0185631.1 Intermediate filament protein [Apophysomyces sp. BC1034]
MPGISMRTAHVSTKVTLGFVAFLLYLILRLQWPYALQSVLWIIEAGVLSLCALLLLNMVVLYTYVKYFVSPEKRRKRHQEFRPLRFTNPSIWQRLQAQRTEDNQRGKPTPICESSVEISDAFEELLSYVLRDFIESWFVHVSGSLSEMSFPKSVDHIIRSAVLALKKRLEEADLLAILLNRIVPKITAHISEFRAAEMSLLGRSLERSVTQSDELDLLLASQFRGGKLHPALTTAAMTTKPTEVVYVRNLVERLLPFVTDVKETQSASVRVVVREMVTCALLQPMFDMIADPDYWNQTIDSYLGKAIREQKMVRKLREVLNRHSTDIETVMEECTQNRSPLRSAPPSGSKKVRQKMGPMNQLSAVFLGTGLEEDWDDQELDPDSKRSFGIGSVHMGRRTFQEFLKMIEEEKNLLDLKRVRNDIVTQIRKKKVLILDRDPEEVMDGEKVEDVIVYINRLSVAKKRVDKRIAFLSGESSDVRISASQLFGTRKPSIIQVSQAPGHSLYDILTNTAGLSYFMEFMDRRGDMMKLQFWLIVQGFKNSDASSSVDQRRDDKTFLQDVRMVYDMYFSENAPHHLPISDQLDKDLRDAIARAQKCADNDGDNATLGDMTRQRLYRIQQHVFWQIEKAHFPYFKRSDLYFKYLASSPNAAPDILPERRSLDETTLFRRSSSSNLADRIPVKGIPPQVIERTASARLIKRETWATRDSLKAESDTEVSARSPIAQRMQLENLPSDFGRSRGHLRAVSENTGRPSRFLSFARVFESANEWWKTEGREKTYVDEDGVKARHSIHESIKSIETEELDTDDEAIMSRSATTVDDQTQTLNVRQQLVRSNTVDAVEAELQSIIDGGEVTIDEPEETEPDQDHNKTNENDPDTKKPPVMHRPSPLLLYGARGVKSTMAMPVQNVYALPSWTSSGGSSTISEIEHDQLEPVGSKETEGRPMPEMSASTSDGPSDTSNVHLAPPGDLMLAAKVEKLSEEMEKLIQQEAIVDALIKKAETKNKVEELRILKKSKNMFRRELQQIKYQKSQYELQESENVLMPERTKVSITSSTIGSDDHGEFALYVIEIQQLGYDGNYASGWIVARRYSEFFALHQKLKDQYPAVKLLEFPAKWPLLTLQKSFVEARRINLERYLRRLLEDTSICKSEELRAFLSQQNVYVPGPDHDQADDSEFGFFTSFPGSAKRTKSIKQKSTGEISPQRIQSSSSSSSLASNKSPSVQNLQRSIAADISGEHSKPTSGFMKHIYKTVAAGIDDMFIGPSMLDLITQRLGEQVMEFSYDADKTHSRTSSSSGSQKKLSKSDFSEKAQFSHVDFTQDTFKNVEAEGITKFTEPLCALFIEMFELKEKNNWLRRQAVVIILQQILGGTIERKLRESVRFLYSEPMVVYYLRRIIDSLWPDGGSLTFKPGRRQDEKAQTREEANRKLSTWLPDLIGNMVGRQNARRGARRLFTVLQNKRLNQDLVYTLFDEVVAALFPELPLETANLP